jgi:hypothetical protein
MKKHNKRLTFGYQLRFLCLEVVLFFAFMKEAIFTSYAIRLKGRNHAEREEESSIETPA